MKLYQTGNRAFAARVRLPAFGAGRRNLSPSQVSGVVRSFVSAAIAPSGEGFINAPTRGEPPIPSAFLWNGRKLVVAEVLSRKRSLKMDRGDAYLKRHWFELLTEDGARIEVYYDREARRGAAQWWLYAIDE